MEKVELALSKEDSSDPHGYHHAAGKLTISKKLLADAIKGMKATPVDTNGVQNPLNMVHVVLSEAINGAQRACAKGEVEHALGDVLKAMTAATGPKPEDARAPIEHALKDLDHALTDLEGMIDPRNYQTGKPLHQDKHAIEDIKHAQGDLQHALKDLNEHESEGHEHTGEDTQCMLKDLKHVLYDLKCANDDLLTAQALFDLNCAAGDLTRSFFQTMMRQITAEQRVLVLKDVGDDLKHAAELSLESGHLSRKYAARLVRTANKLTKSTPEKAQKNHDFANKYINKAQKSIEKKAAKHHVKAEKKKCDEKCHDEYDKCCKAGKCKSLATYAKNEKACWAVSKSCRAADKECHTKCKATKVVSGYFNPQLRVPAEH